MKLEPGGSTDPDNPHEGEEFGYVLNGAVTIHLGNKVYRAKKGETFYYVSGKQHYLTSKVGATVLWISSPPTFDQVSEKMCERHGFIVTMKESLVKIGGYHKKL